MSSRAGLGDSGDSYMVGPDYLMRSDSHQDPENRNVVSSFKSPQTGSCKTGSSQEGLAGKTGVGLTENFAGVEVLAAWSPVDILGLQWAIVSEISQFEVFETVREINASAAANITQLMLWIVGIAIASIIGIV